MSNPTDVASASVTAPTAGISTEGLLPQLVAHLRQNRTALREEWARRITEAQLLTAMTHEEIFTEATAVYDNYVEVLETGSVEALQATPAICPSASSRGASKPTRCVGIVLLLRDVLARSLFKKYQADFDAAEPRARRLRAGGQPHRQHRGASASCRNASASSASSRKPSASCPRRCCRCANGC